MRTPEQLGYEYNKYIDSYIRYKFGFTIRLVIWKPKSAKKYYGHIQSVDNRFYKIEELNELSSAFVELQQDLKELNNE